MLSVYAEGTQCQPGGAHAVALLQKTLQHFALQKPCVAQSCAAWSDVLELC